MIKRIFTSFLAAIGVANALHLPDNDEWYAAPPDVASRSPGDILKSRKVPTPLSLNNITPIRPKAAYQIQYRTQNSVGEPMASVVTVIVPYGAKPRHLFAYAYFTDAACPDCVPSVALQRDTQSDNIYTKVQLAPIIAALNQGWIVSVADDSGPQAAFPAGPVAGYATLDSLRAVKQSGRVTGIAASPVITLSGYSGGGITSAWASELHGSYAPDLSIAGVALGGLIPNFQSLASKVATDASYASWGPPVLVGLSHDYRNLSDWLQENLVPELADDFYKTETLCIVGNTYYNGKNMSQYFKSGAASWDDPVPASVFRDSGIMGLRDTPKAPWYLYETVKDNISPIELTRNLYDKYCSQGANIYYEENQIGLDHTSESLAGFSGAFLWLKDRQNGYKNRLSGCRKVPVSLNTARAGVGVVADTVWDSYLALLGVPVGKLNTFLGRGPW